MSNVIKESTLLRSKRAKFIAIIFIIALLFLIPTVVRAEDTFTTEDGIVVTKKIEGYTQGTVHFDVTNITLDEEKNYSWGLSKSSNVENVDKWYGLNDFSVPQKYAGIDVLVSNDDMYNFLRANDNAYLYIKESDSDNFIVNSLNINLSLPIANAFKISRDTGWSRYYYNVSSTGSGYRTPSIYGINNVYYKFEKITDEGLIEKYRKALSNKEDMSSVIEKTQDDLKNVTGFTLCDKGYGDDYVGWKSSSWPTEQGCYYLYLKAKDADSKAVYGCLIVNIDGDGPKVSSIKVESPSSGTYNTPQTVKIRAYFNETITGTTAPTLTIKFGNSNNRELTNGTIYNSGSTHYIEYSYNIQDSDKGQLATVDFKGGDIKDTSENAAVLTCPVLTGTTIKANEAGTNNNHTDNQDKDNDLTDKDQPTNTDGWTDFSKAEYKLVKNGVASIGVEITGVTPKSESTYYVYISNNSSKPDISNIASDEKNVLNYDNEKNKFISLDCSKEVELSGELYATIIEYNSTENIVSYGKKISRFNEPKYNDAFFETFISKGNTQIVTNFTHSKENNRKMKIKIGKITDVSILNKIRNQDSTGFSDLMNFAKSNAGIYDKVLDAERNNYAISYENTINLNGIEDGAYYYLYVQPDDENGKYISTEAVTLALCDAFDNGDWFMFFYGSNDFKWNNLGVTNLPTNNNNNDPTLAPTILPNTGAGIILLSTIAVLTVSGIIGYIKFNKWRDVE